MDGDDPAGDLQGGAPQTPSGQGFFGGSPFAGAPLMPSSLGLFGAAPFTGAPPMAMSQGFFGFSGYHPSATPQKPFVTFPDSDDEEEEEEEEGPMPEVPNSNGPIIVEIIHEEAEHYPSTQNYSIITFPDEEDEEETEEELDTLRCLDTGLAIVPWPLELSRLTGDRVIHRPGFRRYVNQNPNPAPFVPNLGTQLVQNTSFRMDGDEPAMKKAKLDSGTVQLSPPQEGGPGAPATSTSSSTPDEGQVGTGTAGAPNRRRRPRSPIPAPALLGDQVAPDREIIFEEIHEGPAGAGDQRLRPRPPIPAPALPGNQIGNEREIIFEEIREGPAQAENQRLHPRPPYVPDRRPILAPALEEDQDLPEIIFDGIHRGTVGAANQRRRRNVHRPPNIVHGLNQQQGPPPPPNFPFADLWPILRQMEFADFLEFLRVQDD
ncbi:hypothetical protein B9Z55_022725 [Caenorhabditis nigoni]|uniref:Uncharacterized protein n=1 Tax=Caenorhabditis nigoni TaxID=1611254 RepID=A0A2G5SLJ9_9PELO|nr:hypothetical protein B9Z55_022725 [Caenorhabditis nigoni]